ncbi:hypothetical protein [Pseudomaricurvus sp.]|uniref:hypothetical protein n=1 Tax=Pseudomaricurvus sp. TaxID=2004510 RepID=UPI003F6D7631
MSSTAIIAIIVTVLVILVAYAFISQTIERKRKQRQRQLTASKLRVRDFKYMVSGFPPGFLPKELNLLVYQSLVDACEKLTELEPKVKTHVEELTLLSKQLNEAKQRPATQKRTPLKTPQQVKEAQSLLQALNSYIAQLQKLGKITEAQMQQFTAQIKRLVVEITVDNYILNAKQAASGEKERLAIHFYTLAKKLLAKESREVNYQPQIVKLNDVIAKLEQQVAQQSPQRDRAKPGDEQSNTEWEEFEADVNWKKKAVYD